MIKMLIASPRKEDLADFAAGFKKNNAEISWTDSCDHVLAKAKKKKFDLVVVDEKLPDGANGLDCIKRLARSDPFLNCAAITSLSPEDFHEASEGLGVLMGLPENPGRLDAQKLFEHLTNILNIIKETV